MRKNITEALIEDLMREEDETTNVTPDSLIDQAAASKFYAGLKDKFPFIDYENFHKAYDEAIKNSDLRNYGLFRDSSYEKGVLVERDWIKQSILGLPDDGSKELKNALLTLYDAANQDYPPLPGNSMHDFMVKWDDKLTKGKETILKAAIEKVKNDPETANEYNEYVQVTNNAPIDFTYGIEISSIDPRSISFTNAHLMIGGEKFYLNYEDLVPQPGKEQASINYVSEQIYKGIRRVLYIYHKDNFKANSLPIASKYDRVYFIYNDNLYYINHDFDVYDVSADKQLKLEDAAKIDFKNIKIVAIKDGGWSDTKYHGTYSNFGNTTYYNPTIDPSIGRQCGIYYKESEIKNNGDTEVKFIPDNEIPEEVKQLGLTKGETSHTVMDSSD